MCTSSDSTQSSFEASLVDFLTTTYLLQVEYIIKLVDVCTQYGKHRVLLAARYLLPLKLIIELGNVSIEGGEGVNSS
jgi:hypothetical protein